MLTAPPVVSDGRAASQRTSSRHQNRQEELNIYTFLVDDNHTMAALNNDLEILHVCRKGSKLGSLERFKIYKSFSVDKSKTLKENLYFIL